MLNRVQLRSPRSARGFTVTELVVAMAIMAIVVGQLMLVLTSQNKNYADQERVLDTQQDARIATELVLTDLRMAGFLVPSMVGLASTDGGANAPDVICASDPSIMAPAQIALAPAKFQGAGVTFLVGGAVITAALNLASMDIDGDGDADFVQDRGIIISAGDGSHCARITNIGLAGLVTFTPATPVTFEAGAGSARAVPAVVYEIGPNGLMRNNVLLSPLIENLQIEFAVDANNNGQVDAGEFPIHDLDGFDPADIISVQLSLIAATSIADLEFTGPGMPPTANHVGSAADGFKRRRIVARVSPRNLQ